MPTNIVPTDQPSVFDTLTALGPNQALVTANVPAVGISGFIFDIPDEDRVELASDITDYHVEDNTSIQDNIALRPIKLILRGFVAELTLRTGPGGQPLSSYPNALPLNSPMVPTLAPQATQIATSSSTASANALSATQSQAQNLYQLYQGSANAPTKQSIAFGYFFQLWQGRVITISAETPWGVFNNMAIENLVAVQSRESNQMTDFTVTLKQIRIASTTIVNTTSVAGRAQAQSAASSPTPNGAVGQVPATAQQAAQITQGQSYNPP